MPRRLRPLLLVALGAPLLACASASPRTDAGARAPDAPADGSAPLAATAPRIVDGGGGTLRIQTRQVVAAGAASVPTPPDISLSVEVDTTGRAMIETLSISGRDAMENRDALRDWISRARFAPATRGGVPVRGTFRWTAGR